MKCATHGVTDAKQMRMGIALWQKEELRNKDGERMSNRYNCPNCSAPIGMNEICPYCGTRLGWVPYIAPVEIKIAPMKLNRLVVKGFVPWETKRYLPPEEANKIVLEQMAMEFAKDLPKYWNTKTCEDIRRAETQIQAELYVGVRE